MIGKYAIALTIAGSDSGGGAGIQADLKTFSALGCYGASALTALTAQNTLGVAGIHPVPTGFLEKQIVAVLDDIGANAVKIGMLHSSEAIRTVASVLSRYETPNLVLDPVMVATSGDVLLRKEAVAALRELLVPMVAVITPNIPEAGILLGRPLEDRSELPDAARELCELGCRSVLLKGGHLEGGRLVDVFHDGASGRTLELETRRIETGNTHGTGCTLSSAVAAFLARGMDLEQAVRSAKEYLASALEAGADYGLGKGHGPVHHFHAFWG